jgi:hypothetical protein
MAVTSGRITGDGMLAGVQMTDWQFAPWLQLPQQSRFSLAIKTHSLIKKTTILRHDTLQLVHQQSTCMLTQQECLPGPAITCPGNGCTCSSTSGSLHSLALS